VSIPKEYHSLFENLVEAADNGSLCLVASKDRHSGAPRYVLAIVDHIDGGVVMSALGHLTLDGFDSYVEPDGATTVIARDP